MYRALIRFVRSRSFRLYRLNRQSFGWFRRAIGIVSVIVLTRLPLLVMQIPRILVKCLIVLWINLLALLCRVRYRVSILV